MSIGGSFDAGGCAGGLGSRSDHPALIVF